jgi:hypothetical protein
MARTYGRDNTGTWVEIDDPNYIQLATLAQTLRLVQGESPFFANYGIPAEQSVQSQIAPDAAVNRTQAQFAPYFASLGVVRVAGSANPTYNVTAVFLDGTIVQNSVAT